MVKGVMKFRVRGEGITDLIRTWYHFEGKPDVALNALATFENLSVKEGMDVINGDAGFTGEGETLQFDPTEDIEFKQKLNEYKLFCKNKEFDETCEARARYEAADLYLQTYKFKKAPYFEDWENYDEYVENRVRHLRTVLGGLNVEEEIAVRNGETAIRRIEKFDPDISKPTIYEWGGTEDILLQKVSDELKSLCNGCEWYLPDDGTSGLYGCKRKEHYWDCDISVDRAIDFFVVGDSYEMDTESYIKIHPRLGGMIDYDSVEVIDFMRIPIRKTIIDTYIIHIAGRLRRSGIPKYKDDMWYNYDGEKAESDRRKLHADILHEAGFDFVDMSPEARVFRKIVERYVENKALALAGFSNKLVDGD